MPTPQATDETLVDPNLPPPENPVASDTDLPRVQLWDLVLGGNTVLSDATLRRAFVTSSGNFVSIDDLDRIAMRITRIYRENGYFLSRAVIPPQNITGGVLRLEIIEGYIDRITVEGISGYRRDQVSRIVAPLLDSRPIDVATLERYLLLVEDLPGLRASAVLREGGEGRGATELVLRVIQDDFAGGVSVDNRGSKFIGKHQIATSAQFFGLSPWLSGLRGDFVTTGDLEELHYFSLRYDLPLGDEGTALALTGTLAYTEPGGLLDAEDLVGETRTLKAELTHPIVRGRSANLFGALRFTFRNTATEINSRDPDEEILSEDRIRTVGARLTFDAIDGWNGVSLAEIEFSQGLDIINATGQNAQNLSRTNGRNDFTKITALLQRVQEISPDVSATLAVSGQYSFRSLLSSEEFGIGGARFLRAYDPSELTGDHGIAASLEVDYHPASLMDSIRDTLDSDFVTSISFFGFTDFGEVWLRAPEGTEAQKESAMSIGGGLRFRLAAGFTGQVEVAKPLTRAVSTTNNGYGPRFFFSTSLRF